MTWKGCVAFTGLSALVALAGCKQDLGECNVQGLTPDGRPIEGPAAFDIAYRSTDGLPMYEGQAIVQSSCGNALFCHSSLAERESRFGAPKGYDFDLRLADVGCDPADPSCESEVEACDEQSTSEFCEELERLEDNRSRCAGEAGLMIADIRRGYMPPGEAGDSVQDTTVWLQGPRANDPDGSGPDTVLPSIDSSEGRDIVRNWLACKAPVVGRTEPAPTPDLELKSCDEPVDEDNGVNCVYLGSANVPDPTWSSIYANLIFEQCLSCHAPLNSNQDANPNNPGGNIPGGADPNALAVLDLSGSDSMDTSNWALESHSAVVGALASTAPQGQCAGEGSLVIPNDPAGSIMLQKMKDEQTCGDEMPPAGQQTIITPTIEAVEAWINDGAPNN